MIRLATLLLFFTTSAWAQSQCPPQSIGAWSVPMPLPWQFMTYDLNGIPGVPPGMLTMLYPNRTADTMIGVPQTIAQKFASSPNPQQFYSSNISRYTHLLLLEGTNCPLLLDGTVGALWTQ